MAKGTSDGISAKDWDRIVGYATKYASASGSRSKAETIRRQTLRALNTLRRRYGLRASIEATKAEYVKRSATRESLLIRGFEIAKRRKDFRNKTLIASSLVEFYLAEKSDNVSCARWANELERCLSDFFDS